VPVAVKNLRATPLEGTEASLEGQRLLCVSRNQFLKREKNSGQQERCERPPTLSGRNELLVLYEKQYDFYLTVCYDDPCLFGLLMSEAGDRTMRFPETQD
jgi:hypothetical protein